MIAVLDNQKLVKVKPEMNVKRVVCPPVEQDPCDRYIGRFDKIGETWLGRATLFSQLYPKNANETPKPSTKASAIPSRMNRGFWMPSASGTEGAGAQKPPSGPLGSARKAGIATISVIRITLTFVDIPSP